MKFFKGMVVGTLVSTGVMMMVADTMNGNNIKRKSKKIMKKIGNMI